MLQFLKPFWLFIIKWCAIAGGILLFLFKIKQSGKEEVENKITKDVLKGVGIRNEIENNIANTDDAELKRLHDKWSER